MSWGNLTEERVALYLTEILEALHYLHTWRIAHLDLKVNMYSYNSVELSNKSTSCPFSVGSLASREVVLHDQSSSPNFHKTDQGSKEWNSPKGKNIQPRKLKYIRSQKQLGSLRTHKLTEIAAKNRDFKIH